MNFLLSIQEQAGADKNQPFLFTCQADNEEGARNRASAEHPGCIVRWVVDQYGHSEVPMAELCDLWNQLADVPVTEGGEILEPFLFFRALTHREDIWRWFEAKNRAFIVGEAGQRIGDNHPFRALMQTQ